MEKAKEDAHSPLIYAMIYRRTITTSSKTVEIVASVFSGE